jgi:hypothetical protein
MKYSARAAFARPRFFLRARYDLTDPPFQVLQFALLAFEAMADYTLAA